MAVATISEIYDALYTLVGTTLSDHKALTNSVDIEMNESIFLEKGYGIHFSSSIRNPRNITNFVYVRREITIINTIQVFGGDMDIATRKTAEKNLLTNQDKIIKALEQDTDLGGKVANLTYENDGGVEIIYGEDKKDFIMMRSVFSFEYPQTL